MIVNGALIDTHLGKEVLISLLLNQISWNQFILWRRKLLDLNRGLSPSYRGQSWVQTSAQLHPLCILWNTNGINFYWWQEILLSSHTTYFMLSIKPPLHPTLKYLVHFQFPLWSISTDNLNTMQDSERHLRIKNNYQTKSGKSAVGRCVRPTYLSYVINCLNPTGATRSILKLG